MSFKNGVWASQRGFVLEELPEEEEKEEFFSVAAVVPAGNQIVQNVDGSFTMPLFITDGFVYEPKNQFTNPEFV